MPRLLFGCVLLIACSGDDKAPDSTGVDSDPIDTVDTVDTVDTDPGPLTCASSELEAALASMATWPNLASCAHLWFGAISESRHHSLTFNINMTDRNVTVGQQIVHDFHRPAGQLGSLGVQVGSNLSRICSVSIDTGEAPTIARAWEAESGTVTLEVTSVDDSAGGEGPHPFEVTMTAADVVLHAVDATGDRCPMPDVTWTNVSLGVMPE